MLERIYVVFAVALVVPAALVWLSDPHGELGPVFLVASVLLAAFAIWTTTGTTSMTTSVHAQSVGTAGLALRREPSEGLDGDADRVTNEAEARDPQECAAHVHAAQWRQAEDSRWPPGLTPMRRLVLVLGLAAAAALALVPPWTFTFAYPGAAVRRKPAKTRVVGGRGFLFSPPESREGGVGGGVELAWDRLALELGVVGALTLVAVLALPGRRCAR